MRGLLAPFFLLLMCATPTHAMLDQLAELLSKPNKTGQPIINNFNINTPSTNIHNNNAGSNSNSSADVHANASASAQAQSFAQSFSQAYAHQVAKLSARFSAAHKEAHEFITLNKKKLWCGLVATCYCCVCATAIRGNLYVKKPELWCAWKSSLSFEQLLAIPHTELTKELVHEIQRRYLEPEMIEDFFEPLVLFMNDVSQEMNNLTYYRNLATWTKRLHMSWIIPINWQRYNKITTHIQRLLFIKNLFLTWAAEYKMIHNNAFRRFKHNKLISTQEMAQSFKQLKRQKTLL